MVLGLSIATFTALHVVISLIGIAAGLVWLVAQASGRWLGVTNLVFLATTILTTLTGFLFPFAGMTPAIITGIVSTGALAIALVAIGPFKRRGVWRRIYTASAAFALYLNCFVLVVQSFLKLGPLQLLAPTQTEPPFTLTQGAVLLLLLALGWIAVKRSVPAAALSA
ncbi:hypothetical protein [Rhizorhabdus dicambivorans]|uniref:DUF2306 domain-containing protein n=1 Tax=Rhizorhabdus dicambivorans TaxID=1850238 RepID=A0A2A4FXQ0_9SPHN|nr:hypothetical protein [Rhizorhabdus dicambivorans]ATE66881.1 hypothetical protein CMV14_22745 [Rhizorhabdus dicambivorans]PCE42250.1 hypothetical protein COO09_11545 [Rhizorhabdus dicambivorans]